MGKSGITIRPSVAAKIFQFGKFAEGGVPPVPANWRRDWAPWVFPMLLFCLLFAVSNASAHPVVTEVRQIGDQYLLSRGGEPYFIKGGGGKLFLDRLAAYGGNSVRTWGSKHARAVLDQAQALGLTVTLGLWVQHERHGFDYDDREAVLRQIEKFRRIILEFKDHPALLMWGIGNEVNLNYRNRKVWDTVQEIARMVHELDSNHPTMTVLAGSPARDIRLVMERCPDIEILGVNVYAGLRAAPAQLRAAGWNGPYIVTEWGSDGYWEVGSTDWGAAFEPSSAEKAEDYFERYQNVILEDSERLLGAYVFLWGHSKEKTPTWFGLFTPEGFETNAVDVMRYLWTGSWPQNLGPSISGLSLGKVSSKSRRGVHIDSGQQYDASVTVSDPDGDQIQLKWELWAESKVTVPDFEQTQDALDGARGQIRFAAPLTPGAYRLYVYAYDESNHVATANLPLFVDQPPAVSSRR